MPADRYTVYIPLCVLRQYRERVARVRYPVARARIAAALEAPRWVATLADGTRRVGCRDANGEYVAIVDPPPHARAWPQVRDIDA